MCDDLDSATLDNATFLKAMESLRWANNTSGQYSYIDYKNMGTEELGSVYESLLELVPTVDMPARIFRFIGVEDDESTAGNARKTTGSYTRVSWLTSWSRQLWCRSWRRRPEDVQDRLRRSFSL